MHFEDAQESLCHAIRSGSAGSKNAGNMDQVEVDTIECELGNVQQSEEANKKELLSSLLEYVRQQHVRRLMQTT